MTMGKKSLVIPVKESPKASTSAPPNRTKTGKKRSGRSSIDTADTSNDIAAIFAAVPQRAGQPNTQGVVNGAAVTVPPPAPVVVSDGLYRAKSTAAEAMTLSDDAFFGVDRLKTTRDPTGEHRTRRRDSSGDVRTVTEAELQQMVSNNPKSGTTPHCPFDCDCCY